MRLRVIPPVSLMSLPECLLVYEIQYDSSFYEKKTRPFSKVSLPRGYTHNQALSHQFGIEPHTLLCMDHTLWRQQIIDTITFDLSTEYVSIQFINDVCSRHSFSECEELFKKQDPDSSTSAQTPADSSFPGTLNQRPSESRIKSKILGLLEHLNRICLTLQSPSSPTNHIALVSAMTQSQLSDLKKSTRPLTLMPSARQRLNDLNRSLSQTDKSSPSQKPRTKKRRAPSLRLNKKRKKPKQTGTTVVTESEDEGEEMDSTPTLDLPPSEIYELVSTLSGFRSALVDLFQTSILTLLKAKLPLTYPLWVVQSEIEYMREQYEIHARDLTRILQDSTLLDKFRRRAESESDIAQIDDLEDWCLCVAGDALPVVGENESGTSAETSLEELAPCTLGHQLHNPLVQETCEDYSSSLGHHLGLSWADVKDNEGLDGLTSPYKMSEEPMVYASMTESFSSVPHASPTLESRSNGQQTARQSRDPTPPLSPTSQVPDPSPLPTPNSSFDRILQFPIVALHPALLSAIDPKHERDLAIELSTQLAEERLTIDSLQSTFQTLSLLDEERTEKDRFSGLDRFSDVITTSRLAGGWGEGLGLDNAQDVAISNAVSTVKKRAKNFANQLLQQQEVNLDQIRSPPSIHLPSKQIEAKRRSVIKRRTWLAVTRRLDRPWITSSSKNPDVQQPWPEPIFLKKNSAGKKERRKSDKKEKLRRKSHDQSKSPGETRIRKDHHSSSSKIGGRKGESESGQVGEVSTKRLKKESLVKGCEQQEGRGEAFESSHGGGATGHQAFSARSSFDGDDDIIPMNLGERDSASSSSSNPHSFNFSPCESACNSPDHTIETISLLTGPHKSLGDIVRDLHDQPAFGEDEEDEVKVKGCLSEVDSEWPDNDSPAGRLALLVEL